MKKGYYVASERLKKVSQHEDYGSLEYFYSLEEAKQYALANLPTVIVEQATTVKEERVYLVVAVRDGEYTENGSYCESGDPITTYKIQRASKSTLEETVKALTEHKNTTGVFIGVEVKVFE